MLISMWELLDRRQNPCFLESAGWLRLQMYVLYDPTCEGFRSDELNNVLKNAYEISQQNIKSFLE
jgi:hypothetical protein